MLYATTTAPVASRCPCHPPARGNQRPRCRVRNAFPWNHGRSAYNNNPVGKAIELGNEMACLADWWGIRFLDKCLFDWPRVLFVVVVLAWHSFWSRGARSSASHWTLMSHSGHAWATVLTCWWMVGGRFEQSNLLRFVTQRACLRDEVTESLEVCIYSQRQATLSQATQEWLEWWKTT